MDTKSKYYYQARWKRLHKDKVIEYNRRYVAKHRELINQRSRERLKKLKEMALIDEQSKVKLLAFRAKVREHNRKYRERHSKELNERAKKYRLTHKSERREYDKKRIPYHRKHQRHHRLCTVLNGQVVNFGNLQKRPYPNPANCELCGVEGKRLVYHHYEDTKIVYNKATNGDKPVFLLGFWVCQPCNTLIHKLTEFPFLAEKWFAMLEYQRRGAGYY